MCAKRCCRCTRITPRWRRHLQQVAQRLDGELGDEQPFFVEGCQSDWDALPRPRGQLHAAVLRRCARPALQKAADAWLAFCTTLDKPPFEWRLCSICFEMASAFSTLVTNNRARLDRDAASDCLAPGHRGTRSQVSRPRATASWPSFAAVSASANGMSTRTNSCWSYTNIMVIG
jgi:hypothetical protein